MTTKEKYSYEVKVQIKKGVNFELNVFETPISQRYWDMLTYHHFARKSNCFVNII